MKYLVIAFCFVSMVSCGKKAHEGTNQPTTNVVAVAGKPVTEEGKVATTVVFRQLARTFDIPANPATKDFRKVSVPDMISPVSDKLLAGGIFSDPHGFLKNPLYQNWKAVGPLCSVSSLAALLEVKFEGPQPKWFDYRMAEDSMVSGQREERLGFHDLVNLISKYGDDLPADTPIVALGSVTAFRAFHFMHDMNEIQSPVAIKNKGKWEIWSMGRIGQFFIYNPSGYHPPLFLIEVDKEMGRYVSQAKDKIRIFVRADMVSE
jgi:hypothetical protein